MSITDLGARIEAPRQAKIESADQLASMLEPIAQARTALPDKPRMTLGEIGVVGRRRAFGRLRTS